LNVKGCKNIHDSFVDYCSVETLEGENKYMAEGFGLQDAKKGVIFKSFPPVLHLQLKRFEYDMERDAMVKINDRHEYAPIIELDEFLDSDADRSIHHRYHLHGVLVHMGDLHGGHYIAYIRPDAGGKWFKFDDDKVTPASANEVFEQNFGGGEGVGKFGGRAKRMTNAYMLVYIREDQLNEVLRPVTKEDIPEHLGNFFIKIS
jgi:ubiquitin carboxyl-terminal hydrolase 7